MKKFGIILMSSSAIAVLLSVLGYTQDSVIIHALVWLIYPSVLLIATGWSILRPTYMIQHQPQIIGLLIICIIGIRIVNYAAFDPDFSFTLIWITRVALYTFPFFVGLKLYAN